MASSYHRMFVAAAVVGLLIGGSTESYSQEMPPAPPAEGSSGEAPAAGPAASDGGQSIGVVRVSDRPPGEVLDASSNCPECTVSPDHGWFQPGRVPLNRTLVPYVRWYPNSWTGESPAPDARPVPMIAMPTDTSQLGYTYQHAPAWRASPGMTPPPPRPVDWHIPLYGGAIQFHAATSPAAPTNGGNAAPLPPMSDEPTPADLGNSAALPQLQPVPR